MFEKEAKKWVKEHTEIEYKASYGEFPKEPSAIKSFKAGAEFGYNKANEWHYVKDGDIPPEDTKVLALMAEKEICIAHFYRRNVWDKIGIVIAWKEIVFPKEN